MTAYVYDVDSYRVVAAINSHDYEAIEDCFLSHFDVETCAFTLAPAFGFANGLYVPSDGYAVINL